MDQDRNALITRALVAEAAAYDLQLASARLIGRGRAIVRAGRETRSQHRNTLALAKESLAACVAAVSHSMEARIRLGQATTRRTVIRSRRRRAPG